jgi:hypothetical protein
MNVAFAFVNFVCALGLGAAFFAIVIALFGWPVFFVITALVTIPIGIMWLFQSKCPKCGTRGTTQWLYRRVDGGPDRRYHNNRIICLKCKSL